MFNIAFCSHLVHWHCLFFMEAWYLWRYYHVIKVAPHCKSAVWFHGIGWEVLKISNPGKISDVFVWWLILISTQNIISGALIWCSLTNFPFFLVISLFYREGPIASWGGSIPVFLNFWFAMGVGTSSPPSVSAHDKGTTSHLQDDGW